MSLMTSICRFLSEVLKTKCLNNFKALSFPTYNGFKNPSEEEFTIDHCLIESVTFRINFHGTDKSVDFSIFSEIIKSHLSSIVLVFTLAFIS